MHCPKELLIQIIDHLMNYSINEIINSTHKKQDARNSGIALVNIRNSCREFKTIIDGINWQLLFLKAITQLPVMPPEYDHDESGDSFQLKVYRNISSDIFN